MRYRQRSAVAIGGSYTGCTGYQDDRHPSATPTYIADGYHSQSWRPATQHLAVERITPAGVRCQVGRDTNLMSSSIDGVFALALACFLRCMPCRWPHTILYSAGCGLRPQPTAHESHELRCLTAEVNVAAWRSCVPSKARDLQVVPLARVHHAGDVAAAAAYVAGGVVAHLFRPGKGPRGGPGGGG